MNYHIFILLPWLFYLCLSEVTEEKKAKLLSDFINYYNLRPNIGQRASDGFLRNIREIDELTYEIEVQFTAKHDDTSNLMTCYATVEDLDDNGIAIVNNNINCHEIEQEVSKDPFKVQAVENQAERRPLKLENEEPADTAITSGEQFLAIPRDHPNANCVGCASHVNPEAQGVRELASLGVKHLDIHEPTVKHSLDSVIEVERQVQVINGVRYILTLSINFDHCTNIKTDSCISTKTCKISILVKPWQTLPSGAKYRAILSNNCTEQWLFGDNGEVLPDSTDSNDHNKETKRSSADDSIQTERYEDVQSKPNVERVLTDDEIKALDEQILPLDHIRDSKQKSDTSPSNNGNVHKDHVIKTEATQQLSENSLAQSEPSIHETSSLSEDKKKAIDEMLDFLNFSGYKSQSRPKTEGTVPRVRRSYDQDLQVLSLTEEYRDLKSSIENAKYIYEMAQAMVDYLNEMDIMIKNRAVKNVVKAEEEEDNEKRFMYIQAQVVIPCDNAICEPKETQNKICNGVVDSSNRKNPKVVNTFCYTDTKEMEGLDKSHEIESDDPVLLRLSKEALKRIELESVGLHAMKIKKIVSANTRVASGRLTKISMIVDYINCSKSLPLVLRKKCATLENLGSRICEVLVHERQWLKERKITYTCTERPMDTIITKDPQNNNITIDDPKIAEILQEALQYLEIQSSKKNKQEIIAVRKISTQVLAGFLIKIEFVVGYTNCSSGLKSQSGKCLLLRNERLRRCKAQVWDRSWIVDGRQMEVMCDDDSKMSDMDQNTRPKRAILFRGGSEMEQNINNPKYKILAEESLQKYITDSGNMHLHQVLRIEKVTTQVVSGSMTKINFVAAPADDPHGDVIKCLSKIWEQPWLDSKQIDVSCEIDNHGSKRGLPGGETEKNRDDPFYRKLAEESLQKYIADSGNMRSHQVLRLEKVTTQVVSGSMTRINFVAAPAEDPQGDILTCFSKIWEQPWLDSKQINVTCEIDSHRSKRQVLGGETEQNLDDPQYKKLAEESLQKYITDSGNKRSHQVLRIEKVTTQVVAGSMTRINFVAAPTDDPKGDLIKCFSKIWEQPWLDSKQINVTCEIDSHRSKRQVLGGQTEKNPDDPKYKKLAEDSLQKYITDSGNKRSHQVLRVEKVTTQVVAGSMTRINFVAAPTDDPKGDLIKCFSKIWEQPWLDSKQINVTCEIDSHRSKRQVLGGETEKNPDDPKYKKLAEDSLQKYITDSGNKRSHQVLRVEKVTIQVVAGSMTRINFVAAPTDDPKGDLIKCFSKIWEQPWLDSKQINVTCEIDSHRSKRQVLGGQTEKNPDDPKYKKLAEDSLQKYITDSGNKRSHQVLRVEKVTIQVVAGSMTRINFVAAPTDDPKGDLIKCFSKIWEQPWLDSKQINVTCEIDSHRSKRQVLGGETEKNPDDPKYKKLAEDSLQKYITDSGNKRSHQVLRIEKVTTQVVAGSMTTLNFVAAPTDDPKGDLIKCFSKIWEQPWLDSNQINVSCEIDSHRSKRQVLGGETEQNPDDPKYKKLAEESLQKYITDSGNKRLHQVLRIEKVTTQVVSGFMTRINFVAAPAEDPQGDILTCFSKIWEQTWNDNKQIDVSCEVYNHKSKRQIPGGEMKQNPDDPKYRKLAEESLQKYITDSGNMRSHQVLRIEKVTTQVVAGSMTTINFVVAPTDDPKGDLIKCFSKIWEQPWLNSKQINVTCEIDSHRSKRQILGGKTEQNPNDPQYKKLAEESLQKYITDSGNKRSHQVLRIEKVTTQVVAGSMTRINFVAAPTDDPKGDLIKCFSKIWEQPWLDSKQINVTCEIDSHRSKRQVLGGETEQNLDDPQYKKLAEESLQKYITDSGNKHSHQVLRIGKVTTQVVAGSMTRINFVAAPTDDPKGDLIKCFSKIWEQPWLVSKQINVTCEIDSHRSKRQVLGGETEQIPDDPKYKKLAEDSLQKYITDSGNKRSHKVLRIEKVTTKVVAGSMTTINFVAAPIDDPKGDLIKCFSKIWKQPWLDSKQINVSCEIDNHRSKRQVLGRETEQNPDDPKYKKLAEDSLQKYITDSGNKRSHQVLRIEKVTIQVVAGSMTRINFVAAPTDDPKGDLIKCFSKIWEQPWLDSKQINVTCEIDSHRSKRQVLGGEIEQNSDDPKYKKFAEESLQKYITDSGNKRSHQVLRIEKVTTQVVAGSMTTINFVAAPTDDPKGDLIKCFSKIWEQPWLDSKQINVTCEIDSHRSKRQVLVGETEQNPDDPKYKKLAEELLQKYITDSGNKRSHQVPRIEKVTTKVVAGSMTTINFVAAPTDDPKGDLIKCFSKIWEQPWLDGKQINVTCEIDSHRSKRQILGGKTEQNPNDPQYKKLAVESLQKYITDSGNKRSYQVLRIEKVTTQVVTGSMTRINFVAAPTDDPKGDLIKCFSKIWEQPWLDSEQINVTCKIDSHRSKRQILGGETEQNSDDPRYKKLAEESLQKYITDSGNKHLHQVLRIEKVTTKVVAGSMTTINFVAAPTDDPKGDLIKCFSKIWEQPWLDSKQINVSCEIDSHRSKRQVLGGETEQNPDDPKYKKLAEESLQKYITDSGNKRSHQVLRIERVTTQIVSGSMTKINFVAAPTDNLEIVILNCVSKVWEQSWLNNTEVEVSCDIDSHKSKRGLIRDETKETHYYRSKRGTTEFSLIEEDPNDSRFLKLANDSLQKYLSDSGNKESLKVAKVLKVTTQAVSGTLTRLEFIVLPTNPAKSNIINCNSEVWDHPLTEKRDIKISCQLLYKNVEHPKTTTYLQWAGESLRKYLSDTNNNHPYKVTKIEQANSQGISTKIIFIASSTKKINDLLNCVTEIWDAPWLSEKQISVICERDTSEAREKWGFLEGSNYNKYTFYDPKNIEEEQDVTKPEFHLLALQSLRKFSQRVGILHKLLAVNEVTKSSDVQIVYQMKFIAAPTECLSNVSNIRAIECKIMINATVQCNAKIRDQPLHPKRKISVKCTKPEDYLDLFESEEEKASDSDKNMPEIRISQKNQESKAHKLAEDALEQYSYDMNSKYVHRITAIHSFYEHFTYDIVEFSTSPTKCLRYNFKDSIDNCPFIQPRIIFNCNAKVKMRALFSSRKDIKVTCNELKSAKNKSKKRTKRQINTGQFDDADNEIEEDTMYYYAKSAVSQINSKPINSNLFKLVTIHAVKSSIHMKAVVVKMYIEVAETYCMRYQNDVDIDNCEEMEGLNHKLCFARIFPASDDELIVRSVHVVCDDDEKEFSSLTGLHVFELLRLSLAELERKPEIHHKLVHQGEPQLIPTLESKSPIKLNFIIAFTNCSKTVDLDKDPYQCYLDASLPSKSCSSFIWLETATRTIKYINVDCNRDLPRQKRSSLGAVNLTTDSPDIKELVDATLEKLEMSSIHRYKQRVLHINSYSSKITTGRVTTIDFDVAYTSCVKYEWVKNVTSCDIIDHLPRRHCIAQIWERLWINNGRHINVNCEDDETPLEAHVEFESAEMSMQLALRALKHIEAKYPHPRKQKIVRIFSLEKQIAAGIHYKMKIEVGLTHCLALTTQPNCTLDDRFMNRFCRVNVWVRPWTDHPPNFRVSCDFQESTTSDLYHSVQAEQLFYDFVVTYNPTYVNDHDEFERRYKIFRENIKKIHELNVYEKGTASYGITRFADLTYKEFRSRYTGLNLNLRNNSQVPMKEAEIPNVNLPASFDWRDFDAVTEVKDQGSCGSGWAFSVTGNIEGQWKMQSGDLISLSEQQMLDCDELNKACDGGLPETAYRTIEEQGGLETEFNYPYEAEVDKCLFNKSVTKVKISGAVNITTNETQMAQWLVQNGPISIGINANAMQFYIDGISHPWTTYCSAEKLDHAALIVGFGVVDYPAYHKKIPFWIVKNSWGKSWGNQGYYLVHRGDGTCGVNRMATSAFIPSM